MDSFQMLEKNLELVIETCRQLGIMVNNFQPSTQKTLNEKVQQIAQCLKDMDLLKDNFKEIYLPTDVFEYIDQGKNPQLYTKDCLMKTLKKNEEVKGKIEIFDDFRSTLLNELGKTFPDEFGVYQTLRDTKNPILNQQQQLEQQQQQDREQDTKQ
jgi:mediator of RNA polymerase II transcription subunit 10